MSVEKSAGAVVFRVQPTYRPPAPSARVPENKKILYLLLQYGLGHWGFPRGLIEEGESLEETARREIKEETGIKDLEFLPGFKETIKFFFKFREKNILKFVTYFLAKTKEEKVRLSYEHKDYVWLPYKRARERLTFKNSKEVLKKAHEYLMKHII